MVGQRIGVDVDQLAGFDFVVVAAGWQVSLEWKLVSDSQCQELGQLADLASDSLLTLV